MAGNRRGCTQASHDCLMFPALRIKAEKHLPLNVLGGLCWSNRSTGQGMIKSAL